eukprot:m.60948 g.60948  ORF g.60948 m.60948 type:complete len:179 (+) comp19234_c0_seq1:191-727(+)
MTMALWGGYACQLSVVPLFATQVWGASPGELGLLFSAVSGVGLIATPVGGYLSDKLGRRQAMIPAACLAILGATSLAFTDSFYPFVSCMFAWGLGMQLLSPGLSALAVDISPSHQRGQALSLHRQFGDFSFMLGPITLGVLADATSHSHSLLLYSGLVGLAVATFARRTRDMRKGNKL